MRRSDKVVKIAMILMVLCCTFSTNIEARDFGKISRLDQNWELYWHKLLDPADFQDKEIIFDKKHTFPFFWKDIEIDGKALPSNGFLTLRKVIQVPESLIGKPFALRVPEMFSAYKLFVNGDIKATNGVVSDDPKTFRPEWNPQTITFKVNGKKIELVLQIANFSYKLGGSWRNIEFGLAENIISRTHFIIFMEVFLFASVLTMGLYHIGLFLKRRQSLSSLYFSLLCITVALRSMVSGEILIYYFFNPGWEVLLKLNFITVALMSPLFIKFQHYLFPGCSNQRIVNGAISIGLLFTFFIIIFPAKIHSLFLDLYQFAGLLGGVYIIFVFVRAMIRKKSGALIGFLAFLALFLAGLNDILAVKNVINTEQMLPMGLIVFFVAQSFMLAQKFSSALNREEFLSHELEDLNKKLEEKVEERTIELKLAITEIKQLNGLLPMCAKCKKIRDDKGYWNQIEEYLSAHSDAVFSHSMCPHCIKELYPELMGKMEIG